MSRWKCEIERLLQRKIRIVEGIAIENCTPSLAHQRHGRGIFIAALA